MGAFYPDDFTCFWRTYNPPKNASKAKAYEAYKKASDIPAHDLLIQCVLAYRRFIATNSKPGREYPICHPVTWINQSRWDGFLEEAEAALRMENKLKDSKEANDQASGQTWPAEVLKGLRLSDELLKVWIIPCTLIPGTPAEVIAPKRFHANWLREKYLDKFQRVLGDGVKITYAS